MTDTLTDNLREIERGGAASCLARINRGIEKESLRVAADGTIAATPHPKALGSTLSHRWITTDYSEALLEFITPVHTDVASMLEFLAELHAFTYRNIGGEILWTSSMPCLVGDDESIPIADYGVSNVGLMKHVYRRGLGHRYGRLMQTIAGIHYNFSLPEPFFEAWTGAADDASRSEHYFNLVRNFHRHCWLILYLFGSSPAVCDSFVAGRAHGLARLGKHSLYLPHGATLRMSDLGYRNDTQQRNVRVCVNSLASYTRTLRAATERRWMPYEVIGVKVDGDYRQLNSNLLQIENEFYTVIRPKRTIRPLEKPTAALESRGVEYVEVRCIDLDPFSPIGVDAGTIHFLDAFLLFCLLEPSPPIDRAEQERIDRNRNVAVTAGRDPAATLVGDGAARGLREVADDLLARVEAVADLLERHAPGGHAGVVGGARRGIAESESTPSARIVRDLRDRGDTYFEYTMRAAESHAEFFKTRRFDADAEARLQREAADSLHGTARLEAETDESFDDFLARYFAG